LGGIPPAFHMKRRFFNSPINKKRKTVLLSCAVSIVSSGGDSTEAEKKVFVSICKFASVVLHLAIRVGVQPVWSCVYLLTGTQRSCIVISPSVYHGEFAFGICDGLYAGGKIR
jgi:hypothetical protein